MTEVAQVAAVVSHVNENEHDMSDVEDKEEDMANEEEDVALSEDEAAKEESVETSRTEDKKTHNMNDEGSNETEETHVNGVEHKEENAANETKDSQAVNSIKQDTKKMDDPLLDTNQDTTQDQSTSDLALKKEVRQENK